MRSIKVNLRPLLVKLEHHFTGAISADVLSGQYQSRFLGKGTDFVGYREYFPSDDASMIDWRASVRTNKILVRELTEERNLNVLFAFDVSSSMLCSSISKLKCEYSAELIGTLSYAMMTASDKVGLIMFADRIVDLMLPGKGSLAYHKISQMMGNPKNYGGGIDIAHCLHFILNNDEILPGTVVFIISDFLGLKTGWQRPLRALSQKLMVNAIQVLDPIDKELPDVQSTMYLSDPYSDKSLLVNTQEVSKTYKKRAMEQREETVRLFNKLNVGFVELNTSRPFIGPMMKFFKKKSMVR